MRYFVNRKNNFQHVLGDISFDYENYRYQNDSNFNCYLGKILLTFLVNISTSSEDFRQITLF